MSNLEKALDKLGYPLVLNGRTRRRPWGVQERGFSVDVGHNEDGEEAFVIDTTPNIEILALDTKPKEEATLILIRDNDAPHGEKNIAKMLLGHDERQLYVAAVPTTAKTVLDAKDKLKPGRVHAAEDKAGVKKKDRNKHRNKARIRQGDWFFVPVTDISRIDEKLIKKNQPLRRGGGGNAHMLEEVVEMGGRVGWERRGHFITDDQYAKLESDEQRGYRRTRLNPTVYVRGKVRHPEHKTVKLNGWHVVVPNTENTARTYGGRLTLGRINYTD